MQQIKESTIQKKILDWLNKQSCSYFRKISQGPFSHKGIPDIIGCYFGSFVAFEVKTPKGKTTKLQEAEIKKIQEAKGNAYVVRSLDDVKYIIKLLDKE